MKIKVQVKLINPVCKPEFRFNGDWVDLRASKDITLEAPQYKPVKKETNESKTKTYRNVELKTYYIPLGVAMRLPKGFEAIIDSRSSTPERFGVLIPNGQGVIDNTYCGNQDEWKFVCSPLRKTEISEGDRICQFKIQLSQKATVWQKLRWLFSSGFEFEYVDSLNSNNRGGFGSTGKN